MSVRCVFFPMLKKKENMFNIWQLKSHNFQDEYSASVCVRDCDCVSVEIKWKVSVLLLENGKLPHIKFDEGDVYVFMMFYAKQ